MRILVDPATGWEAEVEADEQANAVSITFDEFPLSFMSEDHFDTFDDDMAACLGASVYWEDREQFWVEGTTDTTWVVEYLKGIQARYTWTEIGLPYATATATGHICPRCGVEVPEDQSKATNRYAIHFFANHGA